MAPKMAQAIRAKHEQFRRVGVAREYALEALECRMPLPQAVVGRTARAEEGHLALSCRITLGSSRADILFAEKTQGFLISTLSVERRSPGQSQPEIICSGQTEAGYGALEVSKQSTQGFDEPRRIWISWSHAGADVGQRTNTARQLIRPCLLPREALAERFSHAFHFSEALMYVVFQADREDLHCNFYPVDAGSGFGRVF